jgi:murein DD-endopeptidase MepM/ murein hydrolase activator NlpD
MRINIKFAVALYIIVFFVTGFLYDIALAQEITPPFDGDLKYPFTKSGSKKCGHWKAGSQDYPYFGAPRNNNTRKHAGIDLYPLRGAGTPVKAIRDGKIIKVAPFYRQHKGEMTYAVLVDHREFVANYTELKKPSLVAGATVKQGETIGVVSGTDQLHFEIYAPGTSDQSRWYGKLPPNLIDPTDIMTKVFRLPLQRFTHTDDN